MNTFVENNKEKICLLIFSTIYLVKSLRNKNIKTIEYTKQVDYINNQFIHKIYRNNEIVYVQNLDEKIQKKYNRNQKWKIIQFYDYDGEIMYEIEPYFENGIISDNTKTLITPDKIVSSINEEKIVEDINTFREKYENSFLLYVIYFCFYNCITIISKNNAKIINLFLYNTDLFDELMKKIINMNKIYFTDLNFDMNNVLPSINNIIKNIQINILKIFKIESYELICDLSNSKEFQQAVMSNVMNFTTNYKIQFVQKENYELNNLSTDLSVFYESYNKLLIPEIPANMKINYKIPYGKNISESNNIDLFNIFCKTLNINSDSMLSVLRYNYNASTNYIIDYKSKSKLKLKTGLTQQEQINMKISPNVNLKELSVSTGGKKSKKINKKNKHKISKKIYKGGIAAVAFLAAAAEGFTAYIAASEVAAAVAAGCTVVGKGIAVIHGTPVVLMAAPAAAATAPIWATVAIGGAVLAGGYGVYNYFNSNEELGDVMDKVETIIDPEQLEQIRMIDEYKIKEALELKEAEIALIEAEKQAQKELQREGQRELQREGQRQADIKALEPQPNQEERIFNREFKRKERIEANEAKIAQKVAAEKQAKRDAQIEGQRQADIKALEPQPNQEERIVNREFKQKERIEANEAKIAQREAEKQAQREAEKQAQRELQKEGQRQADIKALTPDPRQEELIAKREFKQAERIAAKEDAFFNPPYHSTYQPVSTGISDNPEWGISYGKSDTCDSATGMCYPDTPWYSTYQPISTGISDNPEWGISYGKSDTCDSATGMCYQPDAPWYSTYKPQGLPQFNTNNDFNNYNNFLPAGEQPAISQQDFTDFSTVASVGVLALAGIYIFKKITHKPPPPEKSDSKSKPKSKPIPKPKTESKTESKNKPSGDVDLYSSRKTRDIVSSFPSVPSHLPSYPLTSVPSNSLDRPEETPKKIALAVTNSGKTEALEIGGKTLKIKRRKNKKITKKRKNKKFTKKRKI
jgi:hypothetical protein